MGFSGTSRSVIASVSLAAGVVLAAGPSQAQVVLDPLHAFCVPFAACSDNGSVTPVASSTPTFGFDVSPGPQTGNYYIDVLVPNNEDPSPSTLTFNVTVANGGPSNNSSFTAASAFDGLWNSGDLTAFLGRTTSPPNPIGAFLPYTQAHGDSGATGYDVYDINLGSDQLSATGAANLDPILTISPGLQLASVVVGFLNTGTTANPDWISTAQSGALFITAQAVPEPASALLVLGGLLGLCLVRRSGYTRTI